MLYAPLGFPSLSKENDCHTCPCLTGLHHYVYYFNTASLCVIGHTGLYHYVYYFNTASQ